MRIVATGTPEVEEPDTVCATCGIRIDGTPRLDLDGQPRCPICTVRHTPPADRLGAWRAADPEEPVDMLALDRIGAALRVLRLNAEYLPAVWANRVADILDDPDIGLGTEVRR